MGVKKKEERVKKKIKNNNQTNNDMKNTTLLEHLICVISSDCNSELEYTNENQQEETQAESVEEEFHGFDIDTVFAN
ncbi:hypothetical protein GS03_02035 [Flavobacterium sangjuense]|uniref:Uncharacterized protein n=2 Tax=Flavobacterium sangjuense TaxID=2518177 RepID=A0A4P7PU75_9FLAO|nr:hypothetical protein GS03_02035 [Flavobacterium sangjuense]